MKSIKTTTIIILLLIGQLIFAQEMSYKETVVENPTAEQDLKVVNDYLQALINNDMVVINKLLADDFVLSGPNDKETSTKEEEIKGWKEAHKRRTNQKNSSIYQTFRVLHGEYKGDWVSVWGNYSFTEKGEEISIPYQYTAQVKDGKIKKASIYYNRLEMAKKLGYVLTPPKSK